VMGGGSPIALQSHPVTPDRDGYRRARWKFALIPSPPDSVSFLSGEFGGPEWYERVSPPPGGPMVMTSSPLPFGRTTHVAVAPSNIYIGSSDTYEIRAYGSDGSLVRIIRRIDIAPVPVSDAGIEWYIEQRIEELEGVTIGGIPPDLAAIRELMSTWPRVAALPAFSGMTADASGGLWVKGHETPWIQDGSEFWDVFDGDGVLQARVENPAGLLIHEIGEDYVIGVVVDELGVERVRLYDLVHSN